MHYRKVYSEHKAHYPCADRRQKLKVLAQLSAQRTWPAVVFHPPKPQSLRTNHSSHSPRVPESIKA
eukprot:943800-Amorphochlora_amoeboformis.AAC.2